MRKWVLQRTSDILFVSFCGLASGFIFKYFDDRMTYIDMSRLSDFVIAKFALDRVFSEIGVFLLIGLILSYYSSTPKASSLHNLLYFINLNIGYYGYMYHYWGFLDTLYIKFWVTFACITPILGYIVWFTKRNDALADWLKLGMIVFMTICAFSSIDMEFTYKGIVYILIFGVFICILKPKALTLILGILTGLMVILIL